MKLYAKLCGRALAHAHARTGSRLQIAEYLGSAKGFADAIADFSESYADIDEADHAAMLDAIADGRLETHDLV
jgi:predicted alpha/beta hydrolase